MRSFSNVSLVAHTHSKHCGNVPPCTEVTRGRTIKPLAQWFIPRCSGGSIGGQAKTRLSIVSGFLVALCLLSGEVSARESPVIIYAKHGYARHLGTYRVKVEIFSSGKVRYFGGGNGVYSQGYRYGKISSQQLKRLTNTFLDKDFFQLDEFYFTPFNRYRDGYFPDRVILNLKGQKKTIVFDTELRELSTLIRNTVNLKQWACFPNEPESKYCYW
jgi:hypothetical protein